jgi:hypothetical protein
MAIAQTPSIIQGPSVLPISQDEEEEDGQAPVPIPVHMPAPIQVPAIATRQPPPDFLPDLDEGEADAFDDIVSKMPIFTSPPIPPPAIIPVPNQTPGGMPPVYTGTKGSSISTTPIPPVPHRGPKKKRRKFDRIQ